MRGSSVLPCGTWMSPAATIDCGRAAGDLDAVVFHFPALSA